MAVATGLGAAGSALHITLFLGHFWGFGVVGVAGLLAAWLVAEGGRGLVGLLVGIAVVFAVWGGYEVIQKVQSCQSGECSGLSSPGFTLAIAVGFGLIGLASGAAGWLAGRLARAVASRLRTSW